MDKLSVTIIGYKTIAEEIPVVQFELIWHCSWKYEWNSYVGRYLDFSKLELGR